MRPGRDALARAVDSVVEGTGAVDWGLMTIELHDERDRELLRHIRLLSQIADVQRAQPGVDDAALRARARSIASVLPFAEPAREREDESSAVTQDLGEDAPRWGRVELLELVGKGTFGDVYRARDVQLQREVAVKLLHAGLPRAGMVDRMLNEARALARVQHPNVVIVHDAEERDGRAGLCMEFIRGRTLAKILIDEGARGAREAALVGQDLCQALAAVHAAGLVHRDIKAQNVMREDGGRVVLMDFGAGLSLNDGRARPGSVTGTPLYLAPEVLEHGQASVRSDIYSLGVLLYHLVTNDYPLRGQTPEELIDARKQGRVRRLRDAAPKLPSWFVTAVERAIAPNPQDRFATAGEFEAALSRRASVKPWPLLLVAGLTLAVVAGVQQLWSRLPVDGGSLPRVAVLPLDAGLGVEPHVAHAATEEIYQGLAMLDTLRVISLKSAAAAKESQPGMPDIARLLGASVVIDGSVSDAAGQLEVKVRLFRAGSDTSESAQTFVATKAGFGSLRRDSALSIANVVKVAVSPRILTQLTRSPIVSSQAYDAFARARYLHERGGKTDQERAQAELERTIVLEPSFAPAYAALARVHLEFAMEGPSRTAANMALARAQVLKAIALDERLSEAHAVIGQIAFQDRLGLAKGRDFLSSIDRPQSQLRLRAAMLLELSGRARTGRSSDRGAGGGSAIGSALREQRPRACSPSPVCWAISGGGDVDARGRGSRSERFSGLHTARTDLCRHRPSRRGNRAVREASRVLDRGCLRRVAIASAHAAAGRTTEAETILRRLVEQSRSQEIAPELLAFIYVRLGRFDDAFRYLDEAITLKSRRILFLKVDPRWDPLRSDPRFDARVRRLGL